MRIGLFAPAITAALFLASTAYAGKLGDFEEDVRSKRRIDDQQDKKNERKDKHGHRSCLDSCFDNCLFSAFDILFEWNGHDDRDQPEERPLTNLADSATGYTYPEDHDTAKPSDEEEVQPAFEGPYHFEIPEIKAESEPDAKANEPLHVPDGMTVEDVMDKKAPEQKTPDEWDDGNKFFIRLDAAYQNVETDVWALDFFGEAGYDRIGIILKDTEYYEDEPSDELRILYFLGFLKFGIEEILIAGAGVGGIIVEGDTAQSGYAFALPVRIRASKYFGAEFLGIWSSVNDNPIKDYDIGAVAGHENISAKAGYRWVMTENESLNGPYAGITVRF